MALEERPARQADCFFPYAALVVNRLCTTCQLTTENQETPYRYMIGFPDSPVISLITVIAVNPPIARIVSAAACIS